MKYYCRNCGSVLTVDKDKGVDEDGLYCYICYINDSHGEMCPVFDYETPEQYEKRTGKAYPTDGAVFQTNSEGWYLTSWGDAYARQKYWEGRKNLKTVIADPPVPPPDGWRPQ